MVGINKRRERVRLGARGFKQIVVGVVFALLEPVAAAGLKKPESANVLEQAGGAADAAFVGEVEFEGARRHDRRGDFSAEQRPGSGTEEGGATLGGYGCHGGASIVAGGCDHGCPAEFAEGCSGLEDLGQQARGQVEIFEEFGGPGALRGVHELGGCGVGVFGPEVPGEPEVEEVGDGYQRVGRVEQTRGSARSGEDLVERVDRHELNAGDGIDLFTRNNTADGFDHTVVAMVAVVIRVFEKLAFLADERVVDAPGVEGNAREVLHGRMVESLPDLGPEAEDVPAE